MLYDHACSLVRLELIVAAMTRGVLAQPIVLLACSCCIVADHPLLVRLLRAWNSSTFLRFPVRLASLHNRQIGRMHMNSLFDSPCHPLDIPHMFRCLGGFFDLAEGGQRAEAIG